MCPFWMFLKQCHSQEEVFQTPQEEDRDRRFRKEEHLKSPRSPHLLSFCQLQIPSPSSPTDCLHQNFWVEASKFIMSTPPPTPSGSDAVDPGASNPEPRVCSSQFTGRETGLVELNDFNEALQLVSPLTKQGWPREDLKWVELWQTQVWLLGSLCWSSGGQMLARFLLHRQETLGQGVSSLKVGHSGDEFSEWFIQ